MPIIGQLPHGRTEKMQDQDTYDDVPPFLSIKRWCDDFSESRSGFYNRVRAGEVSVIKNGRRTLIPRSEYLKHVERLHGLAG